MGINYILSSCRPFDDDEVYAEHQKAALNSWADLGSHIVLFNQPKEVPGAPEKTIFVTEPPLEGPPTVAHMLGWALDETKASTDSVIAICNSDIILHPSINLISKVVKDYQMSRSWAATSYRWEFAPGVPLSGATVQGMGLDIFIAHRRIWEIVFSEIDELNAGVLTLGRSGWDNWLNSFFRARVLSHRYMDLTPWKVVFHPAHERDNHLEALHPSETSRVVALCPGGLPTTVYPKPELQGIS